MAKNLKYLVIHCTATPPSMAVPPELIRQWHLAPRDLDGGKVRYMGRTYGSRNELPNDTLNGHPVRELDGRGWSVVGYSVLVERGGLMHVLHHFNDDRVVDAWEVTNGVAGHNSVSRHIAYVGGLDEHLRPRDTRTQYQKATLEKLVKRMVQMWPEVKVVGHHDLDPGKACPSFDVAKWGRSIGLSPSNLL